MDATIIRSCRKSYFHISYRFTSAGYVGMAAPGPGDGCQSGQIATFTVINKKLSSRFLRWQDCETVELNICVC